MIFDFLIFDILRFIKQKNELNPEYKVDFFTRLIASGLFIGYVPVASGTFGSLLGLAVFFIPGFTDFTIMTSCIIVFFLVGVITAEIMQPRYGYDPPEVVIDEIVGLWFTFMTSTIVLEFIKFKTFDPYLNFTTKLIFGLTCFFLFRFFDIIKLQPAKYFEEQKNGWGIMMDDIIAGLYAGILSAVVSHFIWFRIFIRIVS